MAIRIAIIEDEKRASDTLKEYIMRYGKENSAAFAITQFPDAIGLLERYSPEYDIVFMDIQMPYMNGMDAAHRLRAVDQKVILIFTTSLTQYAVEGYEVDALSYMVKPFSYPEFSMKFAKAVKKVPSITKADIIINTKDGEIRLSGDDIRYVEIRNHWVEYRTLAGDYSNYSTLKAVEEKLPEDTFARCNSCYLVNLRYVQRINDSFCVMDDGTELKISYPKRQAFLAELKAYRERNKR